MEPIHTLPLKTQPGLYGERRRLSLASVSSEGEVKDIVQQLKRHIMMPDHCYAMWFGLKRCSACQRRYNPDMAGFIHGQLVRGLTNVKRWCDTLAELTGHRAINAYKNSASTHLGNEVITGA